MGAVVRAFKLDGFDITGAAKDKLIRGGFAHFFLESRSDHTFWNCYSKKSASALVQVAAN